MSEELQPLRKNTKKALGRGLGSLLGEINSNAAPNETPAENVKVSVVATERSGLPWGASSTSVQPAGQAGQRVWKVAIEKVQPNKNQPRKHFDAQKLSELANSIKQNGIILPIVARTLPDGQYEIIAGERRWRAAQQAGLKEIPVIVREAENKETLELALVENIQRHDLNPIEEAEAYAHLAEKYALTQQQIADKVGKDRVTVANLLRLMNLAPEVKAMVKAGELQLGQAKVLLGVADPKTQLQLAKKAVQLRLSVRAVEKFVAKTQTNDTDTTDDRHELAAVNQLRQELQRMIGTKVAIQSVGKTRTLSFTFYSDEELNQFVDKLRKSIR